MSNSTVAQSSKDVENLLQDSSSSSEEAWEDWMEWNPPTDSILSRQLVSPSKSVDENPHPPDGARVLAQSPFPRTETSKIQIKKRKTLQDVEDVMPQPQRQNGKNTAVQTRSHSLVEKRYRTNLNDKIALLCHSVPSLRDPFSNPANSHSPTMPVKHNKATVLMKAIEYIQHLEKRNAYLEDANSILKDRPLNIAKETHEDENGMGEEMHQVRSGTSDGSHTPKQSSAITDEEPRGMIPVPEEMKKLRDSVPPQAHYADQLPFQECEKSPSSSGLSIRGGGLVSKLMVGSLAGLTIVDGLLGERKEENRDRGLFALPLPSLLPFLRVLWTAVPVRSGTVSHRYFLIPLIRVFLIFAVLGFTLFLYLFNSKPKLGKSNKTSSERIFHSSSAPIEMRRKAWLTAIQTVWVPRHTMLPELLALTLETHAYMTRRVLGWHSYSWLTSRNEDDEIARVRAWEIAIDAQLTGGDAEISKSRLVLTLWASGTLPNTPARLMLKALHIRILFWQASRFSRVSEAFNCAARHLARKQWLSAQDLVNNPIVSKNPSGSDPLPDHLVALLQGSVDKIMTDSAILNAYNLAWDVTLPGNSEERATYTEDTAMLGSLDSLAVWSCNSKLQHALSAFVEGTGACEAYQSEIELALRVAPPGSISSLKALAAAAVLCESGRRQSINLLLVALRPSNSFGLQETPVTAFPSTALCESISVAVDCATAIETLTHSEDKASGLRKALDLSRCILSKAKILDSLAFAATYQLLLVIVEQISLVGELAGRYNEIIISAITQLDQSSLSTREKNSQAQGIYRGALEKLALRTRLERRVSSISVDTGYGSMSDHDI